MSSAPNLAAIGSLIGDPTRALMLEALNDGRAWTAGELARGAGVTPQTASHHLQKLVDARLLRLEPQGRRRYFRLAGTDVADALEALAVLATRRSLRPGLRSTCPDPLRAARTCYDHLAGTLGVQLLDAMLSKAYLREHDEGYALTAEGLRLTDHLGLDVETMRRARRAFTRKCLDWSERRYHLGGALGASLQRSFLERDWIHRVDGTRAIGVSAGGRRQLRRLGLLG